MVSPASGPLPDQEAWPLLDDTQPGFEADVERRIEHLAGCFEAWRQRLLAPSSAPAPLLDALRACENLMVSLHDRQVSPCGFRVRELARGTLRQRQRLTKQAMELWSRAWENSSGPHHEALLARCANEVKEIPLQGTAWDILAGLTSGEHLARVQTRALDEQLPSSSLVLAARPRL